MVDVRTDGTDRTQRAGKPRRTRLTLSMTEGDRETLEQLANEEGVTMAGLVHRWIREHSEETATP